MSVKIFYGAGKYAAENLSRWIKNGIVPICFVDSDTSKHFKPFVNQPNLVEEDILVYPLDYVVANYADYEIYLTVGVDLLGKVTRWLIDEKKIPIERIKYPDAVETRKGCKFIGTRFQSFGNSFACCCSPDKMLLPFKSDFDESFADYNSFCTSLVEKLRNNEPTFCDKCSQLRYDIWPVNPRIEVIGFDTAYDEDKCNFNCVYCPAIKHINEKTFSTSLVKVLTDFERVSNGEHKNIVLASGEIAISSYRDEVFAIIERNNWNVVVFTNASVYNKKLADLMGLGLAKIQVSMDAGTTETFAAIKGVDCYDKVVSNLKKYRGSENQPTNQPNKQTTKQPTNQPTNQPTKQPNNQTTKQPNNQTTKQTNNQTNKSN